MPLKFRFATVLFIAMIPSIYMGCKPASSNVNLPEAPGPTNPEDDPTKNLEQMKASPPSGEWFLGSSKYRDHGGKIIVDKPKDAVAGDLLFLFLSRTDDVLPMELEGWKVATSCFKSKNNQSSCFEINDCKKPDGIYCSDFGSGSTGRDLAGIAFYKEVKDSDPARFTFEIRGSHATWAVLIAVRGVDVKSPIRSTALTSRDGSDSSLFPSASGNIGDILLLSQSFDDTASESDFSAPSNMRLLGWVNGDDEAGYVYGERLEKDGQSGERKTKGPGGSKDKDLLLTIILKSGN